MSKTTARRPSEVIIAFYFTFVMLRLKYSVQFWAAQWRRGKGSLERTSSRG